MVFARNKVIVASADLHRGNYFEPSTSIAKFVTPFEPSTPDVRTGAYHRAPVSSLSTHRAFTVYPPHYSHTVRSPLWHPFTWLARGVLLFRLSGCHTPSIRPVSVQRSQTARGRRRGPLHRLRSAAPDARHCDGGCSGHSA
jgi:hypothetical protein